MTRMSRRRIASAAGACLTVAVVEQHGQRGLAGRHEALLDVAAENTAVRQSLRVDGVQLALRLHHLRRIRRDAARQRLGQARLDSFQLLTSRSHRSVHRRGAVGQRLKQRIRRRELIGAHRLALRNDLRLGGKVVLQRASKDAAWAAARIDGIQHLRDIARQRDARLAMRATRLPVVRQVLAGSVQGWRRSAHLSSGACWRAAAARAACTHMECVLACAISCSLAWMPCSSA